METLLKTLNLQRSGENERDGQISLCIINNSDGTPRWICNAKSNKPHFLNFYLVSSLRSWMFAFSIRVIFFLRLQRFVFETINVSVKNTDNYSGSVINFSLTNWAIFTGTVGLNNKTLMYEETDKGNYFYKVAYSSKALSLIGNEESALRAINSLGFKSFICPQPEMKSINTLQLEDLSQNGKRSSTFTEKHGLALSELYAKTSQLLKVSHLPIIDETYQKLGELELLQDERLPKGLIRKLRTLINSLDNEMVIAGFSHGDFTPWNIYLNNEKLSIYDWELANPLIPIGFDAFHFITQQGILVDRRPWNEIKQEIKNKISPKLFSGWSKNQADEMERYLELYLLINTVSYLHLYAQQPKWHTQVIWLVNTWNTAISDCMKSHESNRELVIIDVFDYLNTFNYAAIKFPDTMPEMLSEYSDIDLCIQRSDFKKIYNYLNTHPLTKSIHLKKKSFMASVFVYLADGSTVSIDLIWKFKRKSLVMLNASSILENSVLNTYGVRQICPEDQIRYVALFYGLNNAEIPEKFHADLEILAESTATLDTLLYINYRQKAQENRSVVDFLKTKKENRLLHRFKNMLNYYVDSLRPLLFSKGITITFSGVDGAGKSTVIENLKFEIEKKVRKQVVVLRHRPSLLPILSAWIVGKTQAEKDAANSLPRQGVNKGSVSSFLRFSYYYTDYLLGQFYIYAKYISRGWVVLYDRYYFDFINDSKRSNIRLPGFITKAGYKFLLKPEVNFFLYADPEVILSRKQELDRSTIIHLTREYKSLFRKLDKSSSADYIAVENNTLVNTIDLVMNKTFKIGA